MNLPLRDLDQAAADTRPDPKVFVRALITPPGAPWEQARAARLDARHGAPLPLAELLHQVRRLERWAPGRPGRYAAFYVRTREVSGVFETTAEVDGATLTVRFGHSALDLGRLRGPATVLAVLVLCGALLGGGAMLALGARGEAEARLAAAETLAASKLRLAQKVRDRANQARDLRALVGQGRPVNDVVADLTWVATSKTPEARIVGVHWEQGLLAVEARGEQPPFLAADRLVERSAKPLRAGVWLWAIGRPDAGARRAGPVAAEIGP